MQPLGQKQSRFDLSSNTATVQFPQRNPVLPPLSQSVVQRAMSQPDTLTRVDILALQRSIGNHAVQQILSAHQRSDQSNVQADPPSVERKPVVRRTPKEGLGDERVEGARAGSTMAITVHGEPNIQRKPHWFWGRVKNWFGKRKSKTSRVSLQEIPSSWDEQGELSEEGPGVSSRVELEPSQHEGVLRSFKQQFESAMTGLDTLHLDIDGRLAEFAKMAGEYDVEDYSSQIFGNSRVQLLLKQLHETLEKHKDTGTESYAAMVADLLLFASLRISQSQEHLRKRGKSRFTRLLIQTISPARLIELLIQLVQQAVVGGEVSGAASLEGIDLNDKDSIAQRMLKLTLTNMTNTARENLQGNRLFKAMLASPDIVRVMLASGGAVEQQFLNTCAAAAINQEVQTNVSNIAGLLIVGRGLVDYIEEKLNDEELKDSLKKWHKLTWKLKKVTLRQHAQKRIDEARRAFAEIEEEATEIVTRPEPNPQALLALTKRWSRIMQKLSAVTNLGEGSKGVPVLSKKRISENWKGSAALSILMGAPFNRPTRRLQGIDQDTYREALAQTLSISTSKNAQSRDRLNPFLGKEKTERTERMPRLWEKVFEAGGTEFAIPGHELYMQAVIKDNQKVFVVGDPLIDKSTYYTLEEMEKYTRKHKVSIRGDVLSGTTPAAYLTKDDVRLYTHKLKLGSDDERYYVKLGHDTVVKKANPIASDQQQWVSVTVDTDDGEKLGWVARTDIHILS